MLVHLIVSIAVFSDTSESDLQLDRYNDDDASLSDLGYGCNRMSSFITDINIGVGESIYVVVGGYIDSETEFAFVGCGFISFLLELRN